MRNSFKEFFNAVWLAWQSFLQKNTLNWYLSESCPVRSNDVEKRSNYKILNITSRQVLDYEKLKEKGVTKSVFQSPKMLKELTTLLNVEFIASIFCCGIFDQSRIFRRQK